MEGLFGIIAIVIWFIMLDWWREEESVLDDSHSEQTDTQTTDNSDTAPPPTGQYTPIGRRGYYRKYLESDAWQRKRYVVLKRDNWICQKCGARATQVHHKKYARNIGNEPIKWLVSLCAPCHNKIHS